MSKNRSQEVNKCVRTWTTESPSVFLHLCICICQCICICIRMVYNTYQVLPLRVRLNLGAMVMKGCPHSPKPQHHWNLTIRLFSVISRTLVWWGLTPLQRCSRCILQPQPIKQSEEKGVIVKVLDCSLKLPELHLQSHYYVHFRTSTLENSMNPLSLPYYESSSIITVLLQGLFWHQKSYEAWYAIKQRKQDN